MLIAPASQRAESDADGHGRGPGRETTVAPKAVHALQNANERILSEVVQIGFIDVRSSTKESFVKLLPPRKFGVEEALEYVGDDEYVEITPHHVRLRKIELNEKARKRAERERASV